MEVSGQLHAPATFPLGKSARYPFDMMLGGPQNLYGQRGEEKNLASTGTRTATALSWLSEKYNLLVKTEGKKLLEDPDVNRRVILKWVLHM
jgi:hypothetical protein